MQAVFLDRATIADSISLESIENTLHSLTNYSNTTPEQVLERSVDAQVIITNKVVIDHPLITQLPKLKLICITATGTNNVDLVAAKNSGIAVTNVSGYSTQSVAQHVFAYLLNVCNQVGANLALNQSSPWDKSQSFCQFSGDINELSNKILGVVGYGNLGHAVAKIARAFGMQIVIAERPNALHIRDGRVSFAQMLQVADVVTVHCPLTDDTHALFNEHSFSKMKRGSIFINTARGAIVDSNALADSLRSGHLAHAIIDVLEQEPPSADHPLLNADIPNLSLSHHIAWGSLQAQQQLMNSVASNIATFAKGERCNRVD